MERELEGGGKLGEAAARSRGSGSPFRPLARTVSDSRGARASTEDPPGLFLSETYHSLVVGYLSWSQIFKFISRKK